MQQETAVHQVVKTITVLLLSILLASANAQSTRRDGNWWRGTDQSARVAYMVGFFDGMLLGNNFSYWKFINDTRSSDCSRKVNESFSEFSDKFFRNITDVQVVDGLNAFYTDYRNRSVIVNNAVWLVVNEISGTPREVLDPMIENWRRTSTKQ